MSDRSERLDRTHGGEAGAGVLDFSVSINPLGAPAQALQAYRSAWKEAARYPSPYSANLVRRIAAWHGVSADSVIVGNGSTQLIYLLARVLRPSRPAVVVPTFSEVSNALVLAGSAPSMLAMPPERGFCLSADEIATGLPTGADALFVGRPNSPTSTLLAFDDLQALAKHCERIGCRLVIDEAFIEFADDARSAAALLGPHSGLVVLRSLTKIFALPGLRIGYLLAAPALISRLGQGLEPWSVNAVAEKVALACIEAAAPFIERTRRTVQRERQWLQDQLSRLEGMRVIPPAANFLMFRLARERELGDLGRFLLRRAIALRDLNGLAGCPAGFYRVGVRLRPDNERLLAALAAYVFKTDPIRSSRPW